MPLPLPFDYTEIKLRVRTSTLDTIRVLHPNVNEFIRVLTDAYVERVNLKLGGGSGTNPLAQSAPMDADVN